MPFRWNEDSERKILILALKQYTKVTIDAEAIVAEYPGEVKPSVRCTRDRINQLRAQSVVCDFSAGIKQNKGAVILTAAAATATSSDRRVSVNKKGFSSRKASTNKSATTATQVKEEEISSSLDVITPIEVESGISSTVTTPVNVNGTSNSDFSSSNNGGNSKVSMASKSDVNGTANDTNSKAKPASSKKSGLLATTSPVNNLKRKRFSITLSDADSDDPLSTPTKTIGSSPSAGVGSGDHGRRVSLARRSKSATPVKYHFDDSDDDREDSAEEWDGTADDINGVANGTGKGTPKKKGWRERVASLDGKQNYEG